MGSKCNTDLMLKSSQFWQGAGKGRWNSQCGVQAQGRVWEPYVAPLFEGLTAWRRKTAPDIAKEPHTERGHSDNSLRNHG